VLKGHIQLELCKFPSGASGTQLDALARKDMWRYGFNYMHGTGHGVGSYLNVHEGPHQIRMEYRPAPLVEGMTVTDEPGIYLAGRFGVRIENTLLTVPYRDTEFGSFLGFESLTLCPIDLAPVKKEMLLPEEKEWLNAYHRTVYDRLLFIDLHAKICNITPHRQLFSCNFISGSRPLRNTLGYFRLFYVYKMYGIRQTLMI